MSILNLVRHTTAVDLLLVVRIHPTTSRRTCRRPAAKTPRFCMIIFEAGLCARAQNRAMQPSVINFLLSDHTESNPRMWILKRPKSSRASDPSTRWDPHAMMRSAARGACRQHAIHTVYLRLFTYRKILHRKIGINKCDVSKKEIWYSVYYSSIHFDHVFLLTKGCVYYSIYIFILVCEMLRPKFYDLEKF